MLLTNPSHSGSSSSFSFATLAGYTNVVQYRDTVIGGAWQPLQTVVGNGSVTNITDGTASGSPRFYRVVTPCPVP